MIANVSIFPVGRGVSLSAYVAEALEEVHKSGLDYRLTAMGTILEGEWDEVMKVIKKMRDRLRKDSERVYLTISIDDRADKPACRQAGAGRIEAKVKSVESLLAKNLKK